MLEVLDRASMTGTNKLGLLLTLLDLAPTLDGETPSIAPDEVAERYLEIHWEHARPYQGKTLRQSSARKRRDDGTTADDTTVMQEIQQLRDLLKENKRGDLRDKPLGVVERKVEDTGWHSEWQKALGAALKRIRASLLKNPVRLLQKLPGNPEPFLYDLNSDKSGLTLLPGVAQNLTKFGGVLRPLVEFRFAQAVMRINREELKLPVDDVYSHLFGRERVMPPTKMRDRLVCIQDGRCIYTGDQLTGIDRSLDHVVPWSRGTSLADREPRYHFAERQQQQVRLVACARGNGDMAEPYREKVWRSGGMRQRARLDDRSRCCPQRGISHLQGRGQQYRCMEFRERTTQG